MRIGSALLLGVGVTVAAVVFGSRPLGVAGVGLLLAAGAASLWAALVRERVLVTHVPAPAPAKEGDRVRLRIEARRRSRVPAGSVTAYGRLGRLGRYECHLRGRGRTPSGEVVLEDVPRGVFPVSDARLVLGDHLGLESVSLPVDVDGAAIVVHPRLVELAAVFAEAGRVGGHGRRLLLRRPAGFDFHSVREYTQGESLRRVHWPTTARRGQLMVKELEESPQEGVVVLLDGDPTGMVGRPPDSSFDAAVRAAGSILRLYATRRRKATLVTTGKEGAVVRVSAPDDFGVALGALAAAEPDAAHGLARWLGQDRSRSTDAGELVVVTAASDHFTVDTLLGVSAKRLVSVVWVDAASFAGKPSRRSPGLLRLGFAGIPVAVVRQGEDLAAALDSPRLKALRHG